MPLSLSCPANNSPTVNKFYSSGLIASGGTGPYTYSLTAGTLPAGIGLNPATGVLSGTSTDVEKVYPYTAMVTDSLGATASVDCSLYLSPIVEVQQTNGSGATTLSCTYTNAVAVGDVLTVFLASMNSGSITQPWVHRVYDTLGNVYTPIVVGQYTVAYATKSTGSGGAGTVSIKADIDTSGIAGNLVAVMFAYLLTGYNGLNFDQGAFDIGTVTSGLLPGSVTGSLTGTVNTANTLQITIAALGGEYGVLSNPFVIYNSGPTNGALGPIQSIGGFANAVTAGMAYASFSAPGQTYVRIESNLAGSNPPFLASVTFSRPLTNRASRAAQYAIRSGLNAVFGAYGGSTSIPVSLPYMPAIGEVLVIACSSDVAILGISDAYGNSYASVITDVVASPGGNCTTEAWTSTVTFLPTSGLFQVTVTLASSQTSFASRIVYAAGYQDITNTPTAVGFLSSTGAGPFTIATKTLNALGSTRLISFETTYVGQTNGSTSFTPLESYVDQQDWTFAQVDLQITQRARNGLGVLMDKTVNTSGTYDAQVIAAGSTQGMILLGFPYVPPPPPVPVSSSAKSGGSGRIFHSGVKLNHSDLCLARDFMLIRLLDRHALSCHRPPRCWNEHESASDGELIMPDNAETFFIINQIPLPAPADGLVDVISTVVPTGYDGRILAYFHLYTGTGFVESSGDIIWRTRINLRYARNMGNMLTTQGSLKSMSPAEGGPRVFSRQTLKYQVKAPNTSGSLPPPGTGNIVCALSGYFYPRR